MKNRFELSERTTKLVGLLRFIEKGREVAYAELSKQVGETITARNSVYARHILQRDHAAVFICLPTVGLRRLTDLEITERLPGFWLNGARSKLKRGGAEADIVDMHHLDTDQQVSFSVSSIQRELAMETLSKATRSKMEKVARGTSNDLPAFTAIEWAISLSPKKR
ncbi:hypothetical protein WDM22_38695 [Bradyrhizobium septentrionale]|uniref:hypothetical protein n=1 Tax=Bradyrhizobium septentrionale TaxID=1404411 RepID=UPI0030CDB0A5